MLKFLFILLCIYFAFKLLFRPFIVNINRSSFQRYGGSGESKRNETSHGGVTVEDNSANYKRSVTEEEGFTDYEEVR